MEPITSILILPVQSGTHLPNSGQQVSIHATSSLDLPTYVLVSWPFGLKDKTLFYQGWKICAMPMHVDLVYIQGFFFFFLTEREKVHSTLAGERQREGERES